jgi:uncharacterized membrane protein YcaP (DUF421 family)
MLLLIDIDWRTLFIPTQNIWEIILRGTIVYLFLFVLFRVLRRQAGAVSISDLIVVVIIADAAQNAIAGEYKSITEGLILVSTIVGWDYFLGWLDFKFPAMRRLLKAKPLLLIKDGRVQWRNLKKEMITKEELMEKLREQGVGSIEEVKESYLEGNDNISVVKQDSGGSDSDEGKRSGTKAAGG